jgi:hypothetical protein
MKYLLGTPSFVKGEAAYFAPGIQKQYIIELINLITNRQKTHVFFIRHLSAPGMI